MSEPKKTTAELELKKKTLDPVEQKKNSDLENKQKALELALTQIEKQFGKGSIMKLDSNMIMNVEAIPTGSLALDFALGSGGVPR